ncbi:MAG: carotenoid biosynthesis protein [Thermoplasmatota archaeon]
MVQDHPLGRGNWFSRKTTPRLAAIVLVLTIFMFLIARIVPTRFPEIGWELWGDDLVILRIFEISCLSLMIVSVVHAWIRWGRKKTIMFFMFALIYGFILEEVTVTYSQYYEYNPHAWIQISNTMMAVPFCWTAVMYLLVYLIEENPHLSRLTKLEKGMFAGVMAVSIDVAIDAVFVAYGIWQWREGQWFGVPLANYTAWFMAVGGFTALWNDVDKLKAHMVVKELGLAFGIILCYGLLLMLVYLTYLASEVVF